MAEIKYLDKTGLGTVKSILDGLFATKSHSHTKGEIGLGNVDNTADKDKNVKYASSAGYADDSNLLDGKNSTYFDTAPFSTIRDFTLGTLIKTDINYNVTSGDPFYVEIKGNTYVSPGSMHIQIQGYIYNDTIINYSVTSLGVVYPSEIIAKNVGGFLCFWFPRIAYWHGYYIKVTTGYNYSVNRVTDVLDSAEPSGTKRVVLTNIFYTNYSNSNLTISGGGSSGGSSLSIKANSTTYSLTIPTALPASDVYSWAKAANKPSYNAGEVGALPFFKLASGNANDLSQGLTTVTAVITNQEGSNHSAFLTITDIGTPFQLQIPDSSTNYIYKRYKSGSTWSAWTKLSAGYADTAGSAVDQTARNTANSKWTWNVDEIKAVKVNNAGQSSITHYTSIGTSSDTHDSALKNYFNSNKNSIPRNALLGLYSNSYGNGSYYMGYWLSGYDTNPYGGFYVAHYNTPYYVGIMNGSYSLQKILTSTNYTDYVSPKEHTHDYAPATHSHNYLPLSGGTLTGSLTFANGTWNVVGDDAAIGDYNSAGSLGLKSINNNIPAIGFHNSSNTLLGTLKCDAGTLKWNNNTILDSSNLPVKFINDPGQAVLKNSYGLNASYGTSSYGYPTEEYLQAFAKYLQACAPGSACIGYVGPNSQGAYICHVYNSGTNSTTGFPEHITGHFFNHGGSHYTFGTSYGNWYYYGFSNTSHTHSSVIDAGNNGSSTTFAYSKAGLNYTDYTWLAGWNGYELRAVNKSQFAQASHSHTKSQIIDFPTTLSSFTNDSGYITNSPAYLEIMGNSVAYIDFHYNNSTTDFDARIACHANNQLRFHGHLTPSTSTVANAESIGLSNRRFNTIYALNGNFSGKVEAAAGIFDTSDERLKDFYNDIDVDFDKLRSIPKKYFTWKADDKNEMQIGTSAQAVKEVYPELVSEDGNGNLSVSYNKLSVIALAAIDKLHDENQELKSKISTLEERLAKLEKLLYA